MLCEFVGGPENGQRDDVDDACDTTHCTGLSREFVDWYERDPADPTKFLHRGQITMAEYLLITELDEPEVPGFGKLKDPYPDWADTSDLPEWARE